MTKKNGKPTKRTRRSFDSEFKLQAVQMMHDGYSARLVADNPSPGNTNLLCRWKAELVPENGVVAETLEQDVHSLGNLGPPPDTSHIAKWVYQ